MKTLTLLLLFFCYNISFCQSEIKEQYEVEFDFYNSSISLNSSKEISKYKVNLKNRNLDSQIKELEIILVSLGLINQIEIYKDSLKLSDWLTLKIAEYYSYSISQKKAAILVKSIILSKLGYNVNIRSNHKNIYGLIEVEGIESCCFMWYLEEKDKVYIPFQQFYSMINPNDDLEEIVLSNEDNLFSIKIKESFKFKPELVERTFYNTIDNENIRIEIDKLYIDLLNEHLIVKMETGEYTKPKEEKWIKPIVKYLDKIFNIHKYDETEKLNAIVDFVSYNFNYKSDRKNTKWREKPFYPEEMLYYKSGDCEDFSFLTGYLISELTELDIIYLASDINKHVNIAVKMDTIIGIPYTHKEEDYTVIDLTFLETNESEIGNQNTNIQSEYYVLWDPEKEEH